MASAKDTSDPSAEQSTAARLYSMFVRPRRATRSSAHAYHPQVPKKKTGTEEEEKQDVRQEVTIRSSDSLSFVDVLDKLSRQPWYWGDVSGVEAANILMDMPDHSFLVRDSSDCRSLFAITYRTTNGAIGSTRLQFRAGKFSLSFANENMPSFTSVVDLIEYCVQRSQTQPVCSVRINRQLHYVFLKRPLTRYEAPQLQELCRRVVHRHFPRELIERRDSGLPSGIRTFLLSCPFRPVDGSKIVPMPMELETSL